MEEEKEQNKKEERKKGDIKFSIFHRVKKIEKELTEIKEILLEIPEIRQNLLQKEKEEILIQFKTKRGNEFQAKIKVKQEEIEKKEREKAPEIKLISPLDEIRKRFFNLKGL
jgi:hypothetical protein